VRVSREPGYLKRLPGRGTSLAAKILRPALAAEPAGAIHTFFSDRRIAMKLTMKIGQAVLVSSLLVASSLAMAQGAGGGGGGGPAGNDPSGGTNAGTTREGGDMASGTMAHSSKHHMKHSKKTAKPITDTTNTPGANASSDTKGQ
jgi:hypothetical protein